MWLLWVFLLFPPAARADVVFNEIAWMGMLPQEGETVQAAANNEWIELLNRGEEPVLLDGWKIISADGTPDFSLSGTVAPGSFFLLERGSDEVVSLHTADLVYPFKNALSNSGEHLFLRDASGVIRDEIRASSGWPAGNNQTKETMQRDGDVWKTLLGTPNAPTPGSGSVPSGSSSMGTSSSTAPLVAAPARDIALPRIYASAGEDQTVAVGSETHFLARAADASGNPLEHARFWWNFGDGDAKEGRSVSHIFQVPGTYTVGLHVSFDVAAVSDYALIQVVPNQIRISEVIRGEGGHITLENPSDIILDIGGWMMQDAEGKKFIIPPLTKINRTSAIALPNTTTGMRSSSSAISLFYPNGTSVLRSSIQEIKTRSAENPVQAETPQNESAVSSEVISREQGTKKIVVEKNSVAVQDASTVPSAQNDTDIANVSQSSNFFFGGKSFFFFAALFFSAAGAALYMAVRKLTGIS